MNNEFENIISEFINNDTVNEMKKYRQHYETNCFEHCYNVAYYSYKVNKKLKLDYVSATRAGMLHDMFLYDWRKKNNRKGLHAYTHGKTAVENATKIFNLNAKEKSMIETHMWPVTLKLPRSKEAFILTLIDKYCAIKESFVHYKKSLLKFQNIKYASVLLHILIMNISR